MMTCEQIQELLPWYVTGRIGLDDASEIAKHLSTCAACQADFVEAAWMRRLVAGHAASSSPAKQRTWSRVAGKTGLTDLARIDIGSFLVGLNLGVSAASKRYPVYGTLRVMGHNVRVVGRRKKGKERKHVQQ